MTEYDSFIFLTVAIAALAMVANIIIYTQD